VGSKPAYTEGGGEAGAREEESKGQMEEARWGVESATMPRRSKEAKLDANILRVSRKKKVGFGSRAGV